MPIILGFLIVIIVVVAALAALLIGIYNNLVALRQQVKASWSQIDVQLKRRHDLIPNLVNTVQGYAAHERGTLDEVVAARARATGAATPADRMRAEGELSGALGRLLAVSEAYPNLKANENFLNLQGQLSATEAQIASARSSYNQVATQFNTSVQTFPAVVVAGMLGFAPEPFFETPAAEQQAPKVQF
ncbi:MAG TPA: LemA family protein [Verrucomicrobiae bacterium]|jgi:LemA protein|nr:LemA family protein [Verrucomicrobiae bacterium]